MKKLFLFLLVLSLTANVIAQNGKPGFTTEDVTLKTPMGDVFGTLTIPARGKKFPVALIHVGSGPTDRDGNSPLLPGSNNGHKMLGEELAKNGIASLRYDKRGIGKSQAAAGKTENDLKFENYIEDVVAWVAVLKKDKRFSGITLVGHSEGSLITMIAAQRTPVSGYVSIAGAGRRASDVIRVQLKRQLSGLMMEQADAGLKDLEAGKTTPVISGLEALFRASVQPYLISWFKYDPGVEIKKLKIPMLVINGTSDIQVGVEEAKLLSPNPVLIEGMNHVLKQVGTDPEKAQKSYSDPSMPVEPRLVTEIVRFVKKPVKK